jgi:hypothetical protein
MSLFSLWYTLHLIVERVLKFVMKPSEHCK